MPNTKKECNTNSTIRPIQESDRLHVLDMMREFYASDAVFTNGSDAIFHADIDRCIQGSPYLEGYVFEENNVRLGYAMIARSYSTEFGKPCIWIEDIYLKSDCRGRGIGTQFFRYIENKYPDCVFRLEVEADNEKALGLYRKCGFSFLPYNEMIK